MKRLRKKSHHNDEEGRVWGGAGKRQSCRNLGEANLYRWDKDADDEKG